MSIIQVQNLTKIYRMSKNVTVRALDKVNLTVEKGEFLAIMGSSGSGKSTLLHMIAGVDVPTSGSILIEGTNIHKLSPVRQAELRRREVGIIYQAYNLIPTLTVEENIILPRLLDKKPPKQEALDQLLELLQLKDRRKHLPSQLSGGQQQRTAIGRVLLEQPAVLLADEPTGNLDSENTKEILRLLKGANKTYGQTILVVTHDRQVGNIADRQVIMRDGRLADTAVQSNTP